MEKSYIKRPIPIKAIQWTGENTKEIMKFCKDARIIYHEAVEENITADLYIHTLEGDMHANIGDFIIRGVRGEFYPCDGNIFLETYQEV